MNKDVFVFHVGARDNYSVAEFFYKKNTLKSLITDFWIKNNFKLYLSKRIVGKLNRRSGTRLKNSSVFHYPLYYIIFYKLLEKLIRNKFKIWELKGKCFCQFVNSKIGTRIDNDQMILWGYTCGALEVFKNYNSKKNIIKILNQIDPGLEYYNIQKELSNTFPDLEQNILEPNNSFQSRIVEEWELADIIIVNSTYSKQSLVKYGVPQHKINVVPLIYSGDIQYKHDVNKDKKLRIGYVGNINLIKGFLLFAECAKDLSDRMEFRAIGKSWFRKELIQDLSKHITFFGHLNKDEMQRIYNEIDILVFPSYSDGFGMVQLEAMAKGIPVISTKNCGEVVIHNENGFFIENSTDLTHYLKKLDDDRGLLQLFSTNCYKRILDFDFHSFENNLDQVFKKISFN